MTQAVDQGGRVDQRAVNQAATDREMDQGCTSQTTMAMRRWEDGHPKQQAEG